MELESAERADSIEALAADWALDAISEALCGPGESVITAIHVSKGVAYLDDAADEILEASEDKELRALEASEAREAVALEAEDAREPEAPATG